jgi:AraC-like DNA-binding protein/mannose-6-phosphate isomerase-like protein (cupin superfamily)
MKLLNRYTNAVFFSIRKLFNINVYLITKRYIRSTLLSMKPLLQKLPLGENSSFVASTFKTPNFEVGWHHHIEYELILFTEGAGMSFVGNHVGEFGVGDIFFLGSGLPHTFQKSGDLITAAVVVQFRDNCWGDTFLSSPEMHTLRHLFTTSDQGLRLEGSLREQLAQNIIDLEYQSGLPRMLNLLQCLQRITSSGEYTRLSTHATGQLKQKPDSVLDNIFQFTIEHFREKITLDQVAAIAHLSVPAFCHYFKRSTKKTYINFLNEMRLGYACGLLTETNQAVLDIGYDAGFASVGHFHKKFLADKKMTPLQYRKQFAKENISKGKNIGIGESD